MDKSTQRSDNNKRDYKQNVPELRFPGFKGEWSTYKLGDICKFSKGKGISKKDIAKKGTPCIRYGELYTQYDELISETVSRTQLPLNELVLSEENDIIIPSTGETAIDISQASCINKDYIAIGGDINILKTQEDGVFLSYYLNYIKNDIAKMAQGISVIHLYSDQLKSLTVHIPSLEEQRKISKLLLLLNKRIESMEKKYHILGKYSEYTRHLLFEKVSKKSLFYNFEDVFKSISTKPYQIKKSEIKTEGNIPVIDQGQKLIAGYSNDKKYILNNKGIILFGDHTTLIKFIDFNFIVGADGVKLLKPYDKNNNIKFLYYALKEYNISAEGYKRHYSILRQIELPVPSIDIQNKMEKLLSNLDIKRFLLKKEIDMTKEFKKSLLSKMFC